MVGGSEPPAVAAAETYEIMRYWGCFGEVGGGEGEEGVEGERKRERERRRSKERERERRGVEEGEELKVQNVLVRKYKHESHDLRQDAMPG